MDIERRILELQSQVGSGNLEVLDELQKLKRMKEERESYLAMHKTPISFTAGRWCTRINRKQVVRKNRGDLEELIVAYYKENKNTFRELFTDWKQYKEELERVKKSSTTKYANDFKRFFLDDPEGFADVDIRSLNDGDVKEFILRTINRCELTKKAAKGIRLLLSGLLRYAYDKGYTEYAIEPFLARYKVPATLYVNHRKLPEGDQIFCEDEVELLVSYLKKKGGLISYGLILMLQTGMRVGELSALNRDCIFLKDMYIEIRRTQIEYDEVDADGEKHRVYAVQDEPKTAAGFRHIALPDSAIETLRAISKLNPFGEWLFQYDDGKRIKSKAFRDAIRTACRAVGIKERTPHKARKTYASKLYEAGIDIETIKNQMGHESIETTINAYLYSVKRENQKQKEISNVINF